MATVMPTRDARRMRQTSGLPSRLMPWHRKPGGEILSTGGFLLRRGEVVE
jgi:hypothetical protein